MASIVLIATCGCGWKYRNSPTIPTRKVLEEAQDHCLKNKHSLTINGTVTKKVVK